MNSTEHITLSVDAKVVERMRDLAWENRKTFSRYISNALAQWLAENDKQDQT